MFELVKFRKEHILPMLDQPLNASVKTWPENGTDQLMEDQKSSFTGIVNGVPAVCGGIAPNWADRGYLWAIFNEEFKGNFLPVFRGVKHFLDTFPCRRLETAIPVEYENGKRRARMLGFELECERAKKFFPNGGDAALYARVKG